MVTKKTKIIFVTVVILIFIVVAITGFYLINPQSASNPFAFSLSMYPNNGTIMQAQNLTIRADVAYLKGTPEPVTLSASGGPNGTIYQFSNQTGTPNHKQQFSSILTIITPDSATSETYLITISATTNNTKNQTLFNLTIINSQIQVTGTVTGTHVDIAGRPSEDIYPTDIEFKSTSTNQTYSAKVHLPIDAKGMPQKTGNYSIMLSNQQTYRVSCRCFSYPHFIPVYRASIGPENGYFTVDCGTGTDSIIANFTG